MVQNILYSKRCMLTSYRTYLKNYFSEKILNSVRITEKNRCFQFTAFCATTTKQFYSTYHSVAVYLFYIFFTNFLFNKFTQKKTIQLTRKNGINFSFFFMTLFLEISILIVIPPYLNFSLNIIALLPI